MTNDRHSMTNERNGAIARHGWMDAALVANKRQLLNCTQTRVE